jgi:CheY-like chemotaxis protein
MSLKCVLLVDDCEDDQYLGKRVFQRALDNVEIIVAYDGFEAIELLRENKCQPDVILLDINMPRMGGLEFLEMYASGNPTMPPVVAMLTSSAQESDRSKSLSYDCVHDYFVKPLRKENIIELAKFLESENFVLQEADKN